MMSQRGKTGNPHSATPSLGRSRQSPDAAGRPAAANAIDEERILDTAYELLLAIGLRRMTMADISRRARVSRATLYRRWPNVQAIAATLMTREWAAVAAASFPTAAPTARHRLVDGIVAAVGRTREHPLLRKIVDVDPEFLLPYLLHRRGSSTEAQLDLLTQGIRAGHADGSVRDGDPAWQARALLLTAMSFTLSAPIMAAPDELARLDRELRLVLDRYVAP